MTAVAFMTAKGQKQGNIAGNVTEKGREGTIALFAVSYEIETPTTRNRATRAASGSTSR